MYRQLKRYLWNVLIAVDQLVNAMLGGDPDETISSRCAKNIHKPHWKIIGSFLELIDPGHLTWSREDDEGSDAILDKDTKHVNTDLSSND